MQRKAGERMTVYLDNEVEARFGFDWEETASQVAEAVLLAEGCPYEASVSILLTDSEGIRQLNRDFRAVDAPTDVLSFPNIEYETPADFGGVEECAADCFEPDTGELLLGDILINVDKVREQAKSYGHSEKRELAFLVAHSMFHLLGYDHEAADEAAAMEEKQENVLRELEMTREA